MCRILKQTLYALFLWNYIHCFSPILQSALNIKLLIRIFEYMSNDGDDTKSTHRYKKSFVSCLFLFWYR